MSEQMMENVPERSSVLWFIGHLIPVVDFFAWIIYTIYNFQDLKVAAAMGKKGKAVETPPVASILWVLLPFVGFFILLHKKHNGLNLVLEAMGSSEERMRDGYAVLIYLIPLLNIILFIMDFFKWQGTMNQFAMSS